MAKSSVTSFHFSFSTRKNCTRRITAHQHGLHAPKCNQAQRLTYAASTLPQLSYLGSNHSKHQKAGTLVSSQNFLIWGRHERAPSLVLRIGCNPASTSRRQKTLTPPKHTHTRPSATATTLDLQGEVVSALAAVQETP